jgi:hypothetical protein
MNEAARPRENRSRGGRAAFMGLERESGYLICTSYRVRQRLFTAYTPFSFSSSRNCPGSVSPSNRCGTSLSFENWAILPSTGRY